MNSAAHWEHTIGKVRQGPAYKNYLEVCQAVFAMMDYAPQESTASPSAYWHEELEGMMYMLDATPLVVEKLRHHCYHLTGQREFDYRTHHHARSAPLVKALKELSHSDRNNLFVPESLELGGFGYEIEGKLCNADTKRFYESLIALDRAGLLDMTRKGEKKFVAEIGGGWGGFAYQVKTLFPNVTYLIVDFPAVLLFSATYLKTLFPRAKTRILDGSEKDFSGVNPRDFDFVFAPHYLWERLNFPHPDLLINMESFQEMTTAQVSAYVKRAHEWGIPYLYSINKDRSPYNQELTSVRAIMGEHYQIKEASFGKKDRRHALKRTLRMFFQGKGGEISSNHYRHIVGKIS